MFLHLSVILSTEGGLPQCMMGYHPPRTRHPPPGADTPAWSRHPSGTSHPLGPATPGTDTLLVQCMLGDTVNKRAVCILLECNLVYRSFHGQKNWKRGGIAFFSGQDKQTILKEVRKIRHFWGDQKALTFPL